MARRDLALALLLAGCGGKSDSGGGESFMDDLPPSTNCPGSSDTGACAESTSAADDTTGSGGACQVSEDCANGQSCVAPFNGEIGEFACMPGCIGIMDELSWCADATGCCDPDAICTPRGYCVLPDVGTTGGGATTGDGGTASSSGSSG